MAETAITYPFCLKIDALEIPVHLGVTAEERLEAQVVKAWIQIFYPELPNGAKKDAANYMCYDTLCQRLLQRAGVQHFHLVEYLTRELYEVVRAQAPKDVRIRVEVKKPLPVSLVGYKVEGASVVYTDLPGGVTCT